MASTTAYGTTIGQVKWFNTKSGYGFITMLDGDYKDKDIFAHHTNVVVREEQYRYLVQGEYVSCNVVPTQSEDNAVHAVEISGVLGGKLLCEIRREMALQREQYEQHDKTPLEKNEVSVVHKKAPYARAASTKAEATAKTLAKAQSTRQVVPSKKRERTATK